MAVNPLLEQIQKLSIDDRIALVEAVWDQIADDAAKLPLTEQQRRLLDVRIADYEAHPDDVVPWSDVRAELFEDR